MEDGSYGRPAANREEDVAVERRGHRRVAGAVRCAVFGDLRPGALISAVGLLRQSGRGPSEFQYILWVRPE